MKLPEYQIDDKKVVILGDVHAGVRGDSVLFHNRFELFFNSLFSYMKANDLKTIIQVGDLWDRRKFINFNTLDRAKKYLFDKLVEHNIQMYTLIGNHDIPSKNTLKGHSPGLLLQIYNKHVTVIDEPTNVKLGDTTALIVPWLCEDNTDQIMKAMDKSKADLCFGHFEIAGFEMYKGAVCEHGLPKDHFWKFKHVYSGHFHHISNIDNITYVGSMAQFTWADYGDDRGFFVLDTQSLKTEFIKNEFENFHKIVYDDDNLSLEDVADLDFSKYYQTYVRVSVTARSNPLVFEKFMEAINNSGALAHIVEEPKLKKVELEDGEKTEVVSMEETFKTVAEAYKENTDPKKLTKYLTDLYNQSLLEQAA